MLYTLRLTIRTRYFSMAFAACACSGFGMCHTWLAGGISRGCWDGGGTMQDIYFEDPAVYIDS